MNRLVRFLLFLYSVLLALISMVLLYALVDDGIFADLLSPLSTIATNKGTKYIYFAVLMIILIAAVYTITYSILSGRLSKTRVRKTDIGVVDIGADAIESIALNSAKSAQVGIKSARVHVSSAKNDAIKVKIPSSMAKVQEKVKKDIERYTGIVVDSVTVKVSKVEPIVAKVDK